MNADVLDLADNAGRPGSASAPVEVVAAVESAAVTAPARAAGQPAATPGGSA